MKGEKYLISIALVLITITVRTQNYNPYYGITGGLPEVTPEIQARLDAIPEMQLSAISSTTELPEVVDNSQNIFMRPIFEQLSNECGQAAGVAYTCSLSNENTGHWTRL